MNWPDFVGVRKTEDLLSSSPTGGTADAGWGCGGGSISRDRVLARIKCPAAVELDVQRTTSPSSPPRLRLPPVSESESEDEATRLFGWKETRASRSREFEKDGCACSCDGLPSSSMSRSSDSSAPDAFCFRRKFPMRRVGGSSPPSTAPAACAGCGDSEGDDACDDEGRGGARFLKLNASQARRPPPPPPPPPLPPPPSLPPSPPPSFFQNSTLPSRLTLGGDRGELVQLDHVLLAPRGVLAVESVFGLTFPAPPPSWPGNANGSRQGPSPSILTTTSPSSPPSRSAASPDRSSNTPDPTRGEDLPEPCDLRLLFRRTCSIAAGQETPTPKIASTSSHSPPPPPSPPTPLGRRLCYT